MLRLPDMATWLYHRTEPARVFETAGEVEQALAEGWADTPTAFEKEEPSPEPKKRRQRAHASDE